MWEGRGEGGVAIISRVRYRSLIRHAARGNARLESKLDDAREAVSGHLLSSPSALIPLHPTSAPPRRLIHGSSASRPAIQIHFLVAIQITRRKNKKKTRRDAIEEDRPAGREGCRPRDVEYSVRLIEILRDTDLRAEILPEENGAF